MFLNKYHFLNIITFIFCIIYIILQINLLFSPVVNEGFEAQEITYLDDIFSDNNTKISPYLFESRPGRYIFPKFLMMFLGIDGTTASVVTSFISILLFYFFGILFIKKYTNINTNICLLSLISYAPITYVISYPNAQIMSLGFISMAFYFLILKNQKCIILSAILFSFAIFMRIDSAILPFAALFMILYRQKNIYNAILFGLTILLSIFILYSLVNLNFISCIFKSNSLNSCNINLFTETRVLLIYLSIPYSIFTLCGIYKAILEKRYDIIILAAIPIICVIIIYRTTLGQTPRFIVPICMAIAPCVAYGIYNITYNIINKKLHILSLIFISSLFIFISINFFKIQTNEFNNEAFLQPYHGLFSAVSSSKNRIKKHINRDNSLKHFVNILSQENKDVSIITTQWTISSKLKQLLYKEFIPIYASLPFDSHKKIYGEYRIEWTCIFKNKNSGKYTYLLATAPWYSFPHENTQSILDYINNEIKIPTYIVTTHFDLKNFEEVLYKNNFKKIINSHDSLYKLSIFAKK